MRIQKKRVIVALSGGVDSSVAAMLLKKEGYDLIGIYLNLWHPLLTSDKQNICCDYESLRSAQALSQKLNIPFYSIDIKKEFKKVIVDDFIFQYKNGKTPNPCVRCNKFIKFKFMLKKAQELKADYVATGHYAKIVNKSQIFLAKAKDKKKDQSYFLSQLDKNDLKKLLFPIGEYTKDQVREIAKKYDLPAKNRKESQDICFMPSKSKMEFFKKYATNILKKGNILNKNGTIIGKHDGIVNYTIGQRERLVGIDYKKISNNFNKNRIPPLYVLKLNSIQNEIVVGVKDDLFQSEINIKSINWFTKEVLGKTVDTKIRSNAEIIPCKIFKESIRYKIVFNKPVLAVTPGQSIVFYQKNILIGGAII